MKEFLESEPETGAVQERGMNRAGRSPFTGRQPEFETNCSQFENRTKLERRRNGAIDNLGMSWPQPGQILAGPGEVLAGM